MLFWRNFDHRAHEVTFKFLNYFINFFFSIETDFCEPNYRMSFYVVEFWNSLTSLAFVFVPLTFKNLSKNKYKDLPTKPLFETFMYITIISIGFGSSLFHATLNRKMQLSDEIPMMILVILAAIQLLSLMQSNFEYI